ncbi:MAG: hypothetical protein ACRC6A_08405 [Fusobacteriaceae bacterium]
MNKDNLSKLWVSKDLDATIGVFFDGFSKLIVALGVMIGVMNFDQNFLSRIIFPGIASSVAIFNLYFWYQGVRLKKKTGNSNVTSLPSGIIVTKMFLWLYVIMIPIYEKTGDTILTWKVSLVANLISGIVFVILGPFGKQIDKYIPKPAMFGTLSGIAISFLGLPVLIKLFNYGVSGYIVLILFIFLYLGNIKTKFPQSVILLIFATVLSWGNGFMKLETLVSGFDQVGFYLPKLHFDIFSGTGETIQQIIPSVIAFSIMDIFTTLMGIEQAKYVGNDFNINETLVASGALNILGAFLGCPFSCGIYWGHNSWNSLGSRTGYSLALAFVYFIVGAFSLTGIITGIIPVLAVVPFLMFIALKSVEQSFEVVESKFYPAMVIGIIISVNDLLVSKSEKLLKGSFDYLGHFYLAKGSIFISLLYSSITYFIIEKKYFQVGITSFIGCGLSLVGLIHSNKLGIFLNSGFTIGYFLIGLTFIFYSIKEKRNQKGEF